MNVESLPLEQRLYNGARAREVLENEAFQQVFADIEKDLIESWKNIPSSDGPQGDHVRARERLHMSLTMLGKVKACLQSSLETGKLAEIELEHKRTLAERARELVGLR